VPTKEPKPTPFSLETARAIKARIDHLGVSNAAVARRTGLSANYLNERLREEKSFTLSDVERLASYFGVEPGALMRSVLNPDVSAPADTSLIDEIPVLTRDELQKEDLGLAAHHGEDATQQLAVDEEPDQEADDGDDARPGA